MNSLRNVIRGSFNRLLAHQASARVVPNDIPSGAELAVIAAHGKAFDWLADEPDIYSLEDGELV